jgi:cysteine synthase A
MGTLTAAALAPDLGERYLDTIYQTNWVQDLYGDDVLNAQQPTAAQAA